MVDILVRQHKAFGFDTVEVKLRPTSKLNEKTRETLGERFKRLDFWSIEKGISVDHTHAPRHLALRTSDGILIGLYRAGYIDLDAIGVSLLKLRRMEALIFKLVDLVKLTTGRNVEYGTTTLFHVIVKDKALLRFIQTSLASALNPYLKQRLGKRINVRNLLVGLDKNTVLGIMFPNDLDYLAGASVSSTRKPKGFLCEPFSQGLLKQRELARG